MLDEKIQHELITAGRNFMKGFPPEDEDPYIDFESDQDLKKPQPPLVKAPMTDGEHIRLTRDYSSLDLNNDIISLIRDRRSARVYTGEKMTADELSFLLWATQGVKDIRGKNYATLRTVPCGGARHEYETYLLVINIDGLAPGAYHYLPMEHSLEFLHPVDDITETVDKAMCGQKWAAKANVIFFWAMNAYRAEWRYGISAHRVALIDCGHIGQNLYLAATALGLGTCGVGAFFDRECSSLFGLDGEEEFMVYTAPVGTVRNSDKTAEAAFYSFLDEE